MEVVYAGDFEMKKRNRIESYPWLYRRAAADAQGALLFLSFPRFCSRTGTCAHCLRPKKAQSSSTPNLFNFYNWLLCRRLRILFWLAGPRLQLEREGKRGKSNLTSSMDPRCTEYSSFLLS